MSGSPPAAVTRRRVRTIGARLAWLLTAAIGLALCRSALVAVRDFGWGVWPFSLMLCVLAVSCWSVTVALWRTTRVKSKSRIPSPGSRADASREDAP